MDIASFHSAWTVALVVLFTGIVAWAYSSKRKPHFDKAARMALEDDSTSARMRGEQNHG
jgi:cytochrome c oxidase cbb3-type subunit 4